VETHRNALIVGSFSSGIDIAARSSAEQSMMRLGAAFAVGFLALLSGRVSAAPLLEIVTSNDVWSTSATLPLGGPHDVAVTEDSEGWYNANLLALTDVELTLTYLGKEAMSTNVVLVDGVQLFNTTTSSSGDVAGGGIAAGNTWVDFGIGVLTGGNKFPSVANGSNVAPSAVGAPNFWLGYGNDEHSSVYVAFDDGGGRWRGRRDDDDHDDLVFRIDAVAIHAARTSSVVSVPEPTTLWLIGVAFLLAGFVDGVWRHARRRSASLLGASTASTPANRTSALGPDGGG
jgi:hypothetical protein